MNNILTVNGGSSSLKCGLFRVIDETPELIFNFKLANILGQATMTVSDDHGQKRDTLTPDFSQIPQQQRHQACLDLVFNWLRDNAPDDDLTAISHRVVHGGGHFNAPVLATEAILAELKEFIPLAPLHQPYNLKLIEACHQLLPQLPQIACFDTMFHSGQSKEASNFALPRKFTEEGIKRYGFHGLSYEFIQRQLELTAPDMALKPTVVAHLGAGASMCAIKNGKSVTSTMGFTAVDGLPMGSRTGAIDPGVLLYLMRHHHMDADQLENLLYKESGWLGVSGISSDMQELLASDCQEAREAIDLFTYRAGREIGSLSAALQGLEQLVFTGGVGENSAPVRAAIVNRCRWLGAELDTDANNRGDGIISTPNSRVVVRVIATDEEAMLAQHGQEVLDEQ
ncbi:MAG: acetate/propionate family kinase [Motiliproteus sp.]|nr:acetate/propionate family kinase [Motiliproteus sp.]MCW9051424.1 acetate/propionate family kinase [Motiliproteus sp.]